MIEQILQFLKENGLVMAVVAIAAAVVLTWGPRLLPSGAGAGLPMVVTFDTVKYTNATRAVASQFLKNESSGEAAALLLDLPERVRVSIARIAGPDSVVLLKQTVVQGAMTDITDEVLKDLGLPTNVPTQDPTAVSLDHAPTQLNLTGRGFGASRGAPLAAPGAAVLP